MGERSARVIMPFVAGGSSGSVAHLMSERLSLYWRQKFIPENRPDAGVAIAAELVARAPADGLYALLRSYSADRGGPAGAEGELRPDKARKPMLALRASLPSPPTPVSPVPTSRSHF